MDDLRARDTVEALGRIGDQMEGLSDLTNAVESGFSAIDGTLDLIAENLARIAEVMEQDRQDRKDREAAEQRLSYATQQIAAGLVD